MKNLLFTIVALVSALSFAQEAGKPAPAADKPKTEAKPKAEAKTKATPKAKDAKKGAAKPAAKKPGFQAYDAGAWKPVNNRKGHICGYQLSDGDLVHQPVLIVKFDPSVTVDADKKETDPRYVDKFMGWEVKVQPHLQVVNVPSRPLTSDELTKVSKLTGTTAAVPGFPWYEDIGLEKEPENPGNALPFYYVVSTDGKVVYAGDKGTAAKAAVYSALKASGEPHPLFGFVKPEIHAEECAKAEFGKDTTKLVAKLKPIALKGSDDAQKEADAILKALDQTKTYMLKTVLSKVGGEPQEAIILADQTIKTFPRDRQKFQDAVLKLKNNPVVKQSLKTFQTLMEAHQKLEAAESGKGQPMKKADLKKYYQEALKGERMCNKARKEFGEKLPHAFMTLENVVQQVKGELEAAGAGAK